jgi:hypothetical protein
LINICPNTLTIMSATKAEFGDKAIVFPIDDEKMANRR